MVRLEVRFLGDDGRYYAKYNSDKTQGVAISKAAVITLLVIDERLESIIRKDPTLVGMFRQNFLSEAYLQSPADSNETLGSLWNEKLNQSSIWEAVPQRFRNGINTVERIVPLR